MTKLRLRAVKRIDTELDPNFSLSNGFMPSVNVMPPLGSGVMPGRPPSEVKDPKLRAIYEEDRAKNRKRILEIRQQLELKQLNRSFSPATEKHIISAYSQPPYNTEELKHYLDLYEIDKERKDRILKGVEVAIQNNKS